MQVQGLAEERNRLLAELESMKIKVEEMARKKAEEAEARQVERALKEKAEAQKRQLEARIETTGEFFVIILLVMKEG